MSKTKKLISILIIIIYLISLVPFIIASNAGEAGIVIGNQNIDVNSLPDDIQDILIYKKGSYNAILIEDPITEVNKLKGQVAKERKLVLSKETQDKGSFVSIADIEMIVYVTSYNIIDQPFEKLIVGDVKKPEFGDIIETINTKIGQINNYISSTVLTLPLVLSISKVAFLAGGLLVVLILTFLLNSMVALWNIPAIIVLYSFQSFLANLVAFLNNLDVDSTSLMFGLLFIVALPLTFWIQRYERSEEGRQKIHELYEKNNQILSKIKSKFGM
ncbi:hypothetical protein ANME2D_02804 [Candidatus Methanoperedens nitroreducens]|uniref:Uncharacterized protein n=1 Tax=Candidatus Methanoperedens nitratireducens TaxID=1392998 RepID=A0A062V4N6_9EURY|nr:hypothetical protein [Candidatus Methanoperedens nitroreducens]KCZ70779.1 hypothetical protein ANME2D_02804 [Candidatus Methanoperedens nitroreducens]MDJ1420634.1 hypothetical protein [Candidatus Methanoperedens sp.]